ncbi:MAG: DegT/DnrJ/EryC1/StrS family aminotransferase [Opitutae bacterium]|nr:DegT/DnrJ/EryC1/StrS family aminotransferase [Opitutae bacterium]
MGGEELELVKEAFATNWIAPLGPQVDAFEREFADLIGRAPLLAGCQPGVGPGRSPGLHAAALSSGTAALHLAMRWLNLQPGDEVICSTLTFSASVNPVLYERATPVFVDCDDISWNMAPALLAEAIEHRLKQGKKPKAVILVHLYGQSADIDPIAATCAKHAIPLIEDAAEALGAVYYGTAQRTEDSGQMTTAKSSSVVRPPSSGVAPGSVGLCGVHSFNGNKIITTSGGGMLTSNNAKLIDKARFWATQARDPAPHYEHSEIGFNYRMSNVLAAIGRGQLRVLEERVDARRRNCAFYQAAFKDLPGVAFMPEANFGRCTRWLTCITVDPRAAGTDREKIRLALERENIEARPVWKPMHLQPIFKGCPAYGGAVAERLFENGLCLPSGSNLAESDLVRVVEAFRKAFDRR